MDNRLNTLTHDELHTVSGGFPIILFYAFGKGVLKGIGYASAAYIAYDIASGE